MSAKIAEILGFLPKVASCIVLAGACAGPAAAAYIRPVTTNATEFVWIGDESSSWPGANVAQGKITGAHNYFASPEQYGGTHYITNDLTISGETSVLIKGRMLPSFSTSAYNAAVAAGQVPIMQVGPAAGSGKDVVTITLDGKSYLATGYRASTKYGDPDSNGRNNYTTCTNGANGGYAKFVVNGYANYSDWNANFGLWLEHLIISENATPKAGETTIDFLEIGEGSLEIGKALINEFRNLSPYPARVLFNGGRWEYWYIGCGSSYTSLYGDKDNVLILESKNGNPIKIFKTAMGTNLVAGPGTVKFVGSEELWIIANSYYTLKETSSGSGVYVKGNYLPWYLEATVGRKGQTGSFTTRIDWDDFSGDICIGRDGSVAGLQLKGNDQLPWGPGKGKVVLGLKSWSSKKMENITEISALLLEAGKTAHLNGIVGEETYGYLCYVSNISASATSSLATFVLGDGDVDGRFSAKATAKVKIAKEGKGELTICNAEFLDGSVLELKEGTVIVDGAVTLPTGENLIISNGVEVVKQITVNVASGTTTTQSAVYDDEGSVKVRLRKTGAGTLVLDRVNGFSGGLVIDEGIVLVKAADAQGTGKITVNSTSKKTCQIKFATVPASANDTVTYTNDIEVTGKSIGVDANNGGIVDYAAICLAQTNQVLRGSITAADDLTITEDESDVPGLATNLQDLDFLYCYGDVTVAKGHVFYVIAGSHQHYHGKITADTVQVPSYAGHRGHFNLYNTGNSIGLLKLSAYNSNCKTFVRTEGAADGVRIEQYNCSTIKQGSIRGTFEPVTPTKIQSLSSDDYDRTTMGNSGVRAVDTDDNVGFSVGCQVGINQTQSASTLTITGRGEVATAKYCGGVLGSKLSVVIDAPNFTQILSNVYYACQNELKVKKGTLVIDGKTYFRYLKTITVEGDGVLDIRGLGAADPTHVNCLPALTTVNIASTAKLKLAEGIAITSEVVKVDGFQLNANTPTAGRPWLEGKGTLTPSTSPTLPVTATDAVWTGSGTDTATTTAANWENDPLPEFYYIGYRPVFGNGGSEAVFPSGTSILNGMYFNREGDFTVRGAADTKLKLYGTVEVAAGTSKLDQRRYDIAAPLEVTSNSQTWSVPTNRTLRTSGGVTNAEGVASVTLKKQGLGKLELVNSRVAGDVVATDPDCGILSLSGDIGVPGESGQLRLKNYSYHQNSTTKKYGAMYRGYLHLDNATIHKPFDFQSGGSVTCTNGNNSTTWLTQTPGSTNVFKERVTHTGSSTWLLNSDSTIVFEKGYGDPTSGGGGFSVGMWDGCTNGTFIFNGPLQMIYTQKGTLTMAGGIGAKVIFATTGNICTNYYQFNYLTTVFTVDDAFTSTKYFYCIANDTVVDLTTTRQSIPICWFGYCRGELKGEYPSELAITKGPATESAATTTNFYPNAINGWVKISKAGDGYQKIGATATRAYASYGDLEVSGGTLELLSGTTWLNGTNFICRGEGVLKLTSTTKAQIGAQAVFHFADSGKVEIPSGVTYTVDSIYVGDKRIGPGTYTKDSTGDMAGHITGDGKLRIKTGMFFVVK